MEYVQLPRNYRARHPLSLEDNIETNICNLFDLMRPVQMVVRKATRTRARGLHEYSQAVVRSGIGSKFREYFPFIFTHSNPNGC
jgi:hypothetical protein